MIDLNDVLLAMSNIPVDDPIAEIWGRGLQSGYKIIEYTGSLPITINANGEVLIDYRIYGASGGVGETMGNLYNWRTDTQHKFISKNGTVYNGGSSDNKISDKIPVVDGKTYLLINPITMSGSGLYAAFYNVNNEVLSSVLLSLNTISYTLEAPPEATYFMTSLKYNGVENDVTMFIEGSTTPTSYIPYGYKLPMTVSDGNTEQTVPVYIGENQLMEDEYVSYGEQKIYRDVGGTLTPTDSPVPLPEIPTIEGTTIIDYDGDPKPSQMYVKYKGKE